MKPAFVVTITLAVMICLAPRCKAEQRPTDIATSAQNQNPPAVAPPVGVNQAPPDNQGSNKQSPRGDSPAQWILVIVTSITAAFICWQAWETRKAAKAASDSVEAINKQAGIMERQTAATEKAAEAVIGENRPWLLIRGDIQEPDLLFPREGHESLRGCTFRMNNYGKTPARVTFETWELQIGNSTSCPPNEKIFSETKNFPEAYIFPSKFSKGRAAVYDHVLSAKEIEDIAVSKAMFLWLCGVVRYRNTLSGETEYITSYCYLYETRLNVWNKPFWRLAGPTEYNQAT